MAAGAIECLTPVQDALLQEVVDVSVILNALRALRILPMNPRRKPRRPSRAV
jgi:cation transport ATPase